MIGTLINVGGILAGGIWGLLSKKPLSASNERLFKVLLGAFAVFYGLRLTWISLQGSLWQCLMQLLIGIGALMVGKLVGQLFRLQKRSNQLGQFARERITEATSGNPAKTSDGFKVCAALFCAAPLGILGSVQDGLSGYAYPLCVKAAMETLAARSFVSVFGWSVMLAALPVLALQGTITLVCAELLRPMLSAHGLINSINVVGGLLVFSVALVILELKKIELADYLPSLIVAPLITWLLKL
jgi:uncharacterized protein